MPLIVTAEITRPEEVEVTLTVRMTVKAWREVETAMDRTSYSDLWHAARLRDDIHEALRDVEHKALRVSRENDQ